MAASWTIVSDSMCKGLDFKRTSATMTVKSYGGLTLKKLRSLIKSGVKFEGTRIILMLGTCQTDHTDKDTFWKQMEEMRRLILSTHPFCKEVYAAEIIPRVYRPKLCYEYNKHPTTMTRVPLARHFVEHRDQAKSHLFAKDGLHLNTRGQQKLLGVLMGFMHNAMAGVFPGGNSCRNRRRKRQKNQKEKNE